MADVSYNIPDLRPGEVFRVEQTILSGILPVSKKQKPSSNKLKPNLKMPGTTAGLIAPERPDLPTVSEQAMTASLTEPPAAPC